MTPTLELTAEEIAKIEQMRAAAAKKAEDEKRKNMPGFSFRVEMNDGQSVVWSGKAHDADTALTEAKAKANSENDSGILDHCKRLYMPKGRKSLGFATANEIGLADPRDSQMQSDPALSIADAIVLASEGDKEEDQAA